MNTPVKLIVASASAVALSSVAFGGGMEKTPILEKSPIVAPASVCVSPWSITAQGIYLEADDNGGDYDEQEENLGFRGSISYKCDDRLGYRLRYAEWEGDAWGPELTSVDLEVFNNFDMGNWQGEWSVGVRYTTFEVNSAADFDGWGPTAGLELVRPLSDHFSLYLNGRVSVVFGDDDEGDSEDYNPIFEYGGGFQYSFDNMSTYIRLGVEGQSWQEFSNGDTADLFGATAEIGLNF